MSADTDRDSIANDTLQESFGDILNLLDIDDIVSRLHVLKRIPLSELERLQNFNGNLTDQQRKLRLYVTALAGKGQQGLDAFLKALDETADQYEPHALLAKKLRAKLKLKVHYSSPGTSPGTPVVPNRPTTSISSVSECNSSTETCPEMMTARHQQCASCSSTGSSGYGTGTTATNAFTSLEKFDHSTCDMISLKMIILGNVGVGKSALMYQFLHGVYSDSLPTNVGGTRKHWYGCHKAKGVNIKLAIWDTAGNESFNCITPSFYNNVDVVIMVFDTTDNESRKSLYAVGDWCTQLRNYSSQKDVPIILAGNKCESAGVNRTMAEHAERMVTELGFHSFMEVSAKDNIAVDTLFERAVTLALERKFCEEDQLHGSYSTYGSPLRGILKLSIKDEKQMNKSDKLIADKPISSNTTSKEESLDLSLFTSLNTVSIKFSKMNSNEMCDEIASATLHENVSITELNISHNKLTVFGIIEIINALSKKDTIEVLDISYNCIAPNNTDDLAVALSACTQLKILNVSHNSLTFNCVLKIAQRLRDHVNFQTLILSNNMKSFISEAEVLVDIIFSTNNSLTHLDIGGRNIRPRFTGDYLSPPPGCVENSWRFLLQNLYLSQIVSMTDLIFENTSVVTPPCFIKATEECPILDAEIISYYVNHNGGTFYNQDHDFAIVVPPGAVLQSDGTVEIQATGSYKCFKKYQFPNGYLPVSNIFWFSAHYTFKIPVYLIMGHYASSASLKDLHFMQACVRDLTIIEDGKLVMKEVTDGVYIDEKIGYCLFMTDHFCSVCLQKNNTKLPDRFSALFYTYDVGDNFTADLCFVPSNSDCRKEIEKQYQGKKTDISINFEFCKGESLYIPTDFSGLEGWYVKQAGKTQISYDDFEYWRYEELEVLEKNQEYPPRFQIKCIRVREGAHLNLLCTFIVQKKRGNEVISTIGQFPFTKVMKDSGVQRNGTIQQRTVHTSEFCGNPENKSFPKISKLINADWKHIGLLLEVKQSMLDCIDSNYHQRVEDKALHMLIKWKSSNPDACYCHLLSALREQDLFEAVEFLKNYMGSRKFKEFHNPNQEKVGKSPGEPWSCSLM